MKIVNIPKAQPITQKEEVESVTIEIHDPMHDLTIADGESLHIWENNAKNYFDGHAKRLANALIDSLPQGIIEPLIIHLMQHRISLYMGRSR